MDRSAEELRTEIERLVEEYYTARFATPRFEAGKSMVRYAGRVFDASEIKSCVNATLDFWLTAGRYSDEFERAFAGYHGSRHALLVNSGSSANLVALFALTSPLLGERRLKPGDEVIAVAAGFPTTLNPIIQASMIPVFVDVDIGTYNVDVTELERAVSPQTRAIFLAHTLGNPYNLDAIMRIVRKHDLWLIEDCCDALGSTYHGKMVGSFGHLATYSFYPAHHITMGEGGCVLTDDVTLARAVRSFRDWGRDCYCPGGGSNSCGSRFSGRFGTLPVGYDHKYVYSHIGYNLKATDMQAAIGVEQLKKLPEFIRRRKENFRLWTEGLSEWSDLFVLPRATEDSDPSWFAFPLTVKAGAGFTRTELTDHLACRLVETRNLFGGNLLRQPAYQRIAHRVAPGGLERTDTIMNDTFFLGVYPGLTKEQIGYTLESIESFILSRRSKETR